MITHPTEPVEHLSTKLGEALPQLPALMQTLYAEWRASRATQPAAIVRRMLVGVPVIILCNPRDAELVLRQQPSHYPKGVSSSANAAMLQRLRQMRPHFHRNQVATLSAWMTTLIDQHLHQWATAPAGAQHLLAALQRLAQQLMVKTLLGFHLDSDDVGKVATASRVVAHTAQMHLPLASLSLPERTRYREAYELLRTTVAQSHQRNRQSVCAGQATDNLLAFLMDLDMADLDQALAAAALKLDEFSLLIDAAGNIAATLRHTLDLLLAHPVALAQLQAEMNTVVGEQTPTFAHLVELRYTQQILQETLRLHPPVAWLLRIALCEEQIGDHPIPAGALVILPIALYQRDPVFWSNPDQFQPERHAKPRAQPLSWLAFGAGQRLCLGKDFSLITCQLILAMMVQRFDFTA